MIKIFYIMILLVPLHIFATIYVYSEQMFSQKNLFSKQMYFKVHGVLEVLDYGFSFSTSFSTDIFFQKTNMAASCISDWASSTKHCVPVDWFES